MKLLTILLTLALAAQQLSAAVAYTQPPSAGGSGHVSASHTVGGSNFDEFVWDSFIVPLTQTLREIQWRGTALPASHSEFVISINTIALPGGTVWHVADTAHETPVGTTGYSDFRFTLPAGFVMTGGQTYWMQIYAVQGVLPPNWQWSEGTGGNGTHFAQVPAVTGDYNYVNRAGDTAFTLLNAATEPVTITVDRMPAAGGSVTGGGTFNPGDSVTVTAMPAEGRRFINWTEAGVVVSGNASYTFAADGNKMLTANFTGPNTGPYVINAVVNPSIHGNVGGAGTYNADEVVDLDLSSADGVSFVGWTENGELVNLPNSGGGLYQFPAVEDRNLVANFTYTYNTFFINGVVSPAYSGSVVLAGTSGLAGKSYNGGTPITITATPAAAYRFAYWKQGAGLGDLSGAPRIVSTNPVLKHLVCYGTTLTAHFEKNFPTLSTNSFPANSGAVTGGGTYAHGSNVTVNAVPAVGYVFSRWRQSNIVVGTDPSYTYTITNDTSLTADFIATTRTISATASPAEGGSVTGAGDVGNGASVTLTATPSLGFIFSNWTLDGTPAGNTNPITFAASADYTFAAIFTAVPTFGVTTSASPVAGGSTIGGGSFTSGAPATVTATANPGYYFVNWTEAAAEASTLASYQFTVNANRALTANFAAIPVINVIPTSLTGDFSLRWPSSLTAWILQESPDLSPGSWVDSTESITSSDEENQISISNPTGSRFFRLIYQP
jgi:hypothetical protein